MGVRASNQVLALTHEAWKRLNSLASANTFVHSQFSKIITWRKFLRRAWACTLTHSHGLICYIGFRRVPACCVRRDRRALGSEHFLVLPRCPPHSLRGKDSSFLDPTERPAGSAEFRSCWWRSCWLGQSLSHFSLGRKQKCFHSLVCHLPADKQGTKGFL